MDLIEEEITGLYRARKTVMQMLKDWDYIYVLFPDEPKVGVKTIKNYIKGFVHDYTLVKNRKPNIRNMRTIRRQEAELLVQKHVLVPEYWELKNEVKKTVLEGGEQTIFAGKVSAILTGALKMSRSLRLSRSTTLFVSIIP
ncbi:DNA-directed RNA polymerases II and IV subunit 5A-like [Rosa rugosa]|uniref:DNA-directed RNA polymerases II and IV subunit 5A-like n=1 Tax=Rosa rugosa TaxID=74645 RepID=UPI002B417B11|nr:DNA-directed RNA polymerases II and IV subunit 5A-like [Rosa rugosa]